jgi:hypothetical protein
LKSSILSSQNVKVSIYWIWNVSFTSHTIRFALLFFMKNIFIHNLDFFSIKSWRFSL